MKTANIFGSRGGIRALPVEFVSGTVQPDGTVWGIASSDRARNVSGKEKLRSALLIFMSNSDVFKPESAVTSHSFVVFPEDVPYTVKQLRELADYLETLE